MLRRFNVIARVLLAAALGVVFAPAQSTGALAFSRLPLGSSLMATAATPVHCKPYYHCIKRCRRCARVCHRCPKK